MTVTVYTSADGSAPSLTGAVGSLTALLDAVLVNGYGSKSAAGWTIAYTTTNKRVYRNSTASGNTGMYLYIDDTGPSTAKEARACGYQAASGVGAGTGQFPTSAQLALGSGAVIWRKSTTADGTARNWTIVADATVFYLFVETGDYNSPTMTMSAMFGDIFSYASTDTSKCMIIGRNAENNANPSPEFFGARNGIANSAAPVLTYTLAGHFIAANSANVGGSVPVGKHIDEVKCGGGGATASYSGSAGLSTGNSGCPIGNNYTNPSYGLAFPNPVDNGLHFSPIWIHHNGALRGYMKGLWAPVHNIPLNHNDTFSGTGAMSGKSFLAQMILGCNSNNQAPGQVYIETSDTWS